ncbi:MAG TPA: alkaline phosphatase family protein [Candidatus Binataceae bacterium]|nr:alkaline phosphatase family protein [Candidatus Binataceae bacterium]
MKSILTAVARVAPRALAALLALAVLIGARGRFAAGWPRPARIFVLMVWDGLRPDMVTAGWTPNLFAIENEGVRFAHHHSAYPTVTMVNAAAIALGAGPGRTGIIGDDMYLRPRLLAERVRFPAAAPWATRPVDLEDSALLATLNGPAAFAGRLFGFDTLAQQLRRAGGYLAILGKDGPTFVFDDSVTGEPAARGPITGQDYLFLSDKLGAPAPLEGEPGAAPPIRAGAGALSIARDAWFTRVAIERALPAAKRAAQGGRPALIVLWQHNPDLTQHRRGLGTQADIDALRADDTNLAALRSAIASLGIADRTDLMVVSDHGFATIRAPVPLARLLVAQGLKKSSDSDDVIVVADGGSDLVYLSRAAFPTPKSRAAILQKIVDFADTQPWVGPMFTRQEPHQEGLGWVKGTFGLEAAGLAAGDGAPDLVLSFRELSDADNRALTGPGDPIYTFDSHDERRVLSGNRSAPLVVPIKGVIYADNGRSPYTTGMGMHGAAGARELHNFCAAVGPDFRRHFVDQYPTGNVDLRATIARVIGLSGGDAPPRSGAGRSLDEALAGGRFDGSTSERRLSVSRSLPAMETTTTLEFAELAAGGLSWSYLDGSSVAQRAAP